ncbi:MAG: hypothetical protein M1469_06965 [Bacteroidetes bacterium]|nr:hypothetical protein [Bacteroidota bacterium]
MSAYVAAPDYAHAVTLNPAVLASVYSIYAASDYEAYSRPSGESFLPSSYSQFLENGNLTVWDVSAAFPVGPLGGGGSYNSFELGGWRTTTSALALATSLPLGFSLGITGKYITYSRTTLVTDQTVFPVRLNSGRFTFDVGAANRVELSNTTFFRAILSTGAVFSNVLPRITLKPEESAFAGAPAELIVDLPQTFSCGIAYTFASNYRLADFELFKVMAAADYAHLLKNNDPMDDLPSYRDQYRFGLETMALGVLAVRLGYTFKAPAVGGFDYYNNLHISQMGSGFSYGFSLRFPVKLLLPDWPLASLELSYAKNPEWSTGMYHDLFGVVCELMF